MRKIFTVLVFFISLSTRISGWTNDDRLSSKLQGTDLCRLRDFVNDINEIQEQDLLVSPLARAAAENYVTISPRATVVSLQRNLIGNGAHRELHTDITVKYEADQSSQLAEDCDLILIEKLSNGVFADPFQLQRLEQQKSFKNVHIFGDVDLERPARSSSQSVVVIHQTLVEVVGVEHRQLQSTVALPLHARYPPSSTDTYFQLNITMPQVMVNCINREVSSTKRSEGTCIQPVTVLPSQTLHWFIPTGHPLHSSLVDGFTTSAALAGVVLIFLFSKMSNLMCNPSS
ncbi:hypothetical protein Mapa_014063 [Marchantia paleacea]|nr:hypothetical protein Mapa_014063 [Marchantia paleacea]